MLKLKNIEKEKFDEFVEQHKTKSHFLQSLSWGEFSKTKKGLTPYYLGLVNEQDEIVAATLLLEKNLSMNKCSFYAPRGFVMDYKKKELVREMTKKVVEFAKNKKAIYVKIDPDIIKKTVDYEKDTHENKDYESIFQTLKSCGFKHQEHKKNFERKQPKHTFRIDLTQSIENIKEHITTMAKQRIEEADKLDIEVVVGDKNDIKEFTRLINASKEKDKRHNEDYYETLYEIFNGNKTSKLTIFLGKININKTIKSIEKKLKNINNQISILPIDSLTKSSKDKLTELTKQKENIQKEINKYKEIKKEQGNEITLSALMIIEYGKKAWVLYETNRNLLEETYANYKMYLESIKYCKEKGLEVYDHFGPVSDLSSKEEQEKNEFKKMFGGDYIEFIGEWDYITNPVFYFIFTKLVPLYEKLAHKKKR